VYPDEVSVAVKTPDVTGDVNVALDLSIVRTKSHQGTEFELASRGTANPSYLFAALDLAAQHRAGAKSRKFRPVTPLRPSINEDNLSILRNARGGAHPSPVEAAKVTIPEGADSITLDLRGDRRHIMRADTQRIQTEVAGLLTFEMGATAEVVSFCEELTPHVCLGFPGRRTELTPEGGLDVIGAERVLADAVASLGAIGIREPLLVEPDPRQVDAAAAIDTSAVELHIGMYVDASAGRLEAELARVVAAALAAIREFSEIKFGHFLRGQAIFEGLPTAARRVKETIVMTCTGGCSNASCQL
jgi:pyridoxine 5-phosphate synthase